MGPKESFRGHIASVEFETPKASRGPGPLWGPDPLPSAGAGGLEMEAPMQFVILNDVSGM